MIAVTGAKGFLGTYVTDLLSRKKVPFRTLDRPEHDLTKPESLQSFLSGATRVVHLAGVNRDTDEALIAGNTLATMGLVEGVRRFAAGATILFASSQQVYLKKSLYGLSKRLGEQCLEYGVRACGLRALVLRIANMYGPGGRPFYNSAIATFAHLIGEGSGVTINGSGQQLRDYLYADDVAGAIMKAVNVDVGGYVSVDICSGSLVSVNHIIALLRNIAKKEIVLNHKNALGDEEPWPKKSYKGAQTVLGWQPKTPLEDGLRKTLEAI